MADETKDRPAPDQAGPVDSAAQPPERPVQATEGARAETGAPKTDSAPVPERAAAATSDTFKTAPSTAPVEAAPAVAGGTNAPHVSQPVAEKAAPAAAAPAAPGVAAGAKPAPAPAHAAAASAAKATATPAASGTAPAPPAGEKPAAPAARPAAARPAAKTADADMTRRGFFSWAAVAWVGFTAAIGGCVTAMGRFMFPNVLFEPPTTFKVGQPENFQPGVVDTRFVDQYGVWVVNNAGQIYALIAVCTHLGCPPAWLETQNKFKCPCHGSGYDKLGINFEGPTPRPLERARVSLSPDDGQIVVDKAQKYQYELGQWDDPNSYIPA